MRIRTFIRRKIVQIVSHPYALCSKYFGKAKGLASHMSWLAFNLKACSNFELSYYSSVVFDGQGFQTLHLAVGIDRIDAFPFSYEAGGAMTYVQAPSLAGWLKDIADV